MRRKYKLPGIYNSQDTIAGAGKDDTWMSRVVENFSIEKTGETNRATECPRLCPVDPESRETTQEKEHLRQCVLGHGHVALLVIF